MSDHRRNEINARLMEAAFRVTLEPDVYEGHSAYRTRYSRVHDAVNHLLLDRRPASRDQVRTALGIPADQCLECELGIADIHAAGRAARAWREGPR